MVNFSNKHRIFLGVVIIAITIGAAGYAAGYYESQQQQLQQQQKITRVVMCPVGSIGVMNAGSGRWVKNGTSEYLAPNNVITFTVLVTINCYATYYYNYHFIAIVALSASIQFEGGMVRSESWSYIPQVFIPAVGLNTYDDPFSLPLGETINGTISHPVMVPITVRVTLIAYSNDTAVLDNVMSRNLTLSYIT